MSYNFKFKFICCFLIIFFSTLFYSVRADDNIFDGSSIKINEKIGEVYIPDLSESLKQLGEFLNEINPQVSQFAIMTLSAQLQQKLGLNSADYSQPVKIVFLNPKLYSKSNILLFYYSAPDFESPLNSNPDTSPDAYKFYKLKNNIAVICSKNIFENFKDTMNSIDEISSDKTDKTIYAKFDFRKIYSLWKPDIDIFFKKAEIENNKNFNGENEVNDTKLLEKIGLKVIKDLVIKPAEQISEIEFSLEISALNLTYDFEVTVKPNSMLSDFFSKQKEFNSDLIKKLPDEEYFFTAGGYFNSEYQKKITDYLWTKIVDEVLKATDKKNEFTEIKEKIKKNIDKIITLIDGNFVEGVFKNQSNKMSIIYASDLKDSNQFTDIFLDFFNEYNKKLYDVFYKPMGLEIEKNLISDKYKNIGIYGQMFNFATTNDSAQKDMSQQFRAMYGNYFGYSWFTIDNTGFFYYGDLKNGEVYKKIIDSRTDKIDNLKLLNSINSKKIAGSTGFFQVYLLNFFKFIFSNMSEIIPKGPKPPDAVSKLYSEIDASGEEPVSMNLIFSDNKARFNINIPTQPIKSLVQISTKIAQEQLMQNSSAKNSPQIISENSEPIDIKEWVKGSPIKLEEEIGKRIVVLDFWATWCPPCIENMTHLTELQKKYKNDVVIIGITDEDIDTVKNFLNEADESKKGIIIALDNKGTSWYNYMEKFKESAIPHSFVIDKTGKIVWHGHPMQGLDQILKNLSNN